MKYGSFIMAILRDRGRELIVVSVLGICIMFAVPGWNMGQSAEVRVSARVAPTFSLSLLTSGNVDFGEVMLGGAYTADSIQTIEVRSSRAWEFVDSSVDVIEIDGHLFEREAFLRHGGTLPFGNDHPPGVHTIDFTYTLDLTSIQAFDLPTETPIQAMFGYTAVQKQ